MWKGAGLVVEWINCSIEIGATIEDILKCYDRKCGVQRNFPRQDGSPHLRELCMASFTSLRYMYVRGIPPKREGREAMI
jgi:hypothetical protein